MDPEKSPVSVKHDVKPSSSTDQRSCVVSAGGSSDGKDSILVEKVQDIALDSGKTASIHLTARNKAGIFEEEEEGELDYEEDEGEIVTAQEDKNGVKNDTEADDKEEGELEEGDEQGEEGEEGEILSDEETKDNAEKKPQEKKDLTNEGDGPEEGEVIENGDTTGSLNLRKKVCRYFTYGGCTWGMSCRFLHPGLNDKGAYQMLPVPGQYPSPFPKPAAVVPPVHPDPMMPSFPDKEMAQMDEDMAADRTHPISEPTAPPKKETAWERGLKLAKEIKKAAQKRKEEDADFEEKRMILGITAEGDEDENDKENMIRRREMMRNRLDKGSMFYEEEDRNRRGGDIVTRWRDKRDTSPVVHHRDRERRKKRAHRTPSSSPERDRRSRRRGGEKEKQKEKTKEISKEREKERTRKPDKEKAGEDKVKKKKDKSKEIPEAGKDDSEVKQETGAEETEPTTSALKDPKKDTTEEKKNKDEDNKKRIQEMSAVTKTTKETEKKEDVREIGGEEKDKYKPKALGISSSRLPNDEWIDPWQRTTSPKRHSVSSRSSRSRSSSSSSNSSRSSRSRSHSGSESRSTSRSASRSRSRSVSPTSSRSRSRSGSRSKSRSRSGSRSSRSDRSSSTSSNSPARDAKTVQAEDKAQTHSGSESESNKPPVQKSPTKLKSPADNTGPQTPPVEPDRNIKENRNRIEYGQADRIDKPSGSGGWGRRGGGVRPLEEPYSRQRGHHSRRGRSPDRRKRSRSPRGRNEDRRRADQSKTRERSSSADSMEHALARPSSPRTTRERGGGRHGSSASSSSSESSDTGSESEDEQHPAKTRRAAPRTEQLKQAQNVPLTSGNIRYTGHKDIKLTLNKSVARTDNTNSSNPSQHSPPSRSEANSSTDKQADSKKRPRDPSPVPDAAVITAKEAVSSSVTPTNKPEKRSADSPAEQVSSGKSNNPNTSSRREELLRELKAVEDAIARKRARIE